MYIQCAVCVSSVTVSSAVCFLFVVSLLNTNVLQTVKIDDCTSTGNETSKQHESMNMVQTFARSRYKLCIIVLNFINKKTSTPVPEKHFEIFQNKNSKRSWFNKVTI